ncbi:transporter substrate-binding domain-containing protein [Vibrio sp. JC009]|uniref:substrate-binding periplasmic protein n=1 Tax=Vibrio sp. JC009 TaxID=2912314 RepID=UPI0023AE8DED|nr:transporter substrate-binding domain-containing protein [Vibrio sp. JC009]WED23778.1 transporter substrate-binding domain-containing protein [Vibrio sp. JC009]
MRLFSVLLSLLFAALPVCGHGEDLRFITEPTVFTDEQGQAMGGDAKLTRDLMRRLSIPGDIEVYPWKRAYALMQSEPDVVLFPTTRTEARENQAKWVGPIVIVTWVFYANKDSDIVLNSLEEAKELGDICGYIGDAKLTFLEKSGFKNLLPRYRNLECLELLVKGRVDLWVSTLNAPTLVSDTGPYEFSDLKVVYTLNKKYLYYALSKEIPDETVELLQKTLDDMKREGALLKHYRNTLPDELIKEMSQVEPPVFPWKTGGNN